MKLKQLFLNQVVCFLFILVIMYISGCSVTRPTGSTGVLSSIQQKTLNLATERAVQQAGVEASLLEGKKIYFDISGVGAADLGKQHVSTQVSLLLQRKGARIVDNKNSSDSTIDCDLNIAGVDTRHNAFLFWRSIDTIAEVDLMFEILHNDGISEKRKGKGISTFHQGWFLGIGPSESLK